MSNDNDTWVSKHDLAEVVELDCKIISEKFEAVIHHLKNGKSTGNYDVINGLLANSCDAKLAIIERTDKLTACT